MTEEFDFFEEKPEPKDKPAAIRKPTIRRKKEEKIVIQLNLNNVPSRTKEILNAKYKKGFYGKKRTDWYLKQVVMNAVEVILQAFDETVEINYEDK